MENNKMELRILYPVKTFYAKYAKFKHFALPTRSSTTDQRQVVDGRLSHAVLRRL